MSNLLFKEKLVVLFCWGVSSLFLGSGLYDFLNAQSNLNNLIISTGVAITLFSAGLIPKMFYIPLKSACQEIQSPILVNVKTQQYMTLAGIVISSLGLGMQLLA